MEIVTKNISELSLDPSNARLHPAKNIDAIKASLRRFGQQKPIVINRDGSIIAGNGTFIAARELGWGTIKVVETNLSGIDLVAYGIADNRTGELAEWHKETLGKLIKEITAADNSVDIIPGYDESEIREILGQTTLPDLNLGDGDLPPGNGGGPKKKYLQCPHCQKEFEVGEAKEVD